jgi:mannose-6-phosphate isomerase-like protein (cupin superfamily)
MSGRLRRDEDASPFVTLDGSTIRELVHPAQGAARAQSLAEATVPPGGTTTLHRHQRTEEFYHLLRGRGRMHLAGEDFDVGPGDTVIIPPGTPHRIHNPGAESLVFLCCCAPAYDDEDTELLE